MNEKKVSIYEAESVRSGGVVFVEIIDGTMTVVFESGDFLCLGDNFAMIGLQRNSQHETGYIFNDKDLDRYNDLIDPNNIFKTKGGEDEV